MTLAAKVPTRAFVDSATLPKGERKKILKRVEKGTLGSSQVRTEVRLAKQKLQWKPIKQTKTPDDFINEFRTKGIWLEQAIYAMVKNQERIEQHFKESQKRTLRLFIRNLIKELNKSLVVLE